MNQQGPRNSGPWIDTSTTPQKLSPAEMRERHEQQQNEWKERTDRQTQEQDAMQSKIRRDHADAFEKEKKMMIEAECSQEEIQELEDDYNDRKESLGARQDQEMVDLADMHVEESKALGQRQLEERETGLIQEETLTENFHQQSKNFEHERE